MELPTDYPSATNMPEGPNSVEVGFTILRAVGTWRQNLDGLTDTGPVADLCRMVDEYSRVQVVLASCDPEEYDWRDMIKATQSSQSSESVDVPTGEMPAIAEENSLEVRTQAAKAREALEGIETRKADFDAFYEAWHDAQTNPRRNPIHSPLVRVAVERLAPKDAVAAELLALYPVHGRWERVGVMMTRAALAASPRLLPLVALAMNQVL